MSSKKEEEINLYIAAITTRDPSKRQIKPVDKEAFQLFEDFESGSDEDFVLNSEEESDENENDKEKISDEDDDDKNDQSDEDEEKENSSENCSESDEAVVNSELLVVTKSKLDTVMICMMCLLDVTYSDNEIIECDGCGVVVHEDCYKICDNVFMSCDNSDSSTDPWFCDACLSNVHEPRCELCPVEGGVFKRTENNCWVHLQCALYIPGVAFNDVETLTEITLSELPLREWSGRECCICTNPFYAKTGICISCDAGLCKNFFHVLCAQKEGLLSEPNIEENPDDPYFAQCLQHTDKETAKRRRKNWIAAANRQRLRIEDWNKNDHFTDARLHRKLDYFSSLYQKIRQLVPTPFVASKKVPCYLETNPVAVFLFKKKATNLRLSQDVLNSYTTTDCRTGTGVPVFTPDFITHFLDREKKIDDMSQDIVRLQSSHRDMQISEQNTSHQFNKIMTKKESIEQEYSTSRDYLITLSYIIKHTASSELTKMIKRLLSRFPVKDDDNATNDNNNNNNTTVTTTNDEPQKNTANNCSDVTNNNNHTSNGPKKKDSIINECCKCYRVSDQHLIIECDDCHKYFHLNCLEPPLQRMPKKTRLYGWQCSSCVRASSEEDRQQKVDVNRPRQLRKLTDVTSRYKPSRILQNCKDIAKRISKRRLEKKKIEIATKIRMVKPRNVTPPLDESVNESKTSNLSDTSQKLSALNGPNVFIALQDMANASMLSTAASDTTHEPSSTEHVQRKSHRPKKRPMTLLDEFEPSIVIKRRRLSKVFTKTVSITKSSKSLPPRKKRSLASLKSLVGRHSHTPTALKVESEYDDKPLRQPITFFPSTDRWDSTNTRSPESDQVQIGVVAKKVVGVGVGWAGGAGPNSKVLEKKPVLIKWHGDQDDAGSEKGPDYGRSVSTEHSRRSL